MAFTKTLQGELWIDGDGQKAYGDFGQNQRNERIRAAHEEFPTLRIHSCPHDMNWELVG
jgi:hypothetical protein